MKTAHFIIMILIIIAVILMINGCCSAGHNIHTHQESSIVIDEDFLYPDSYVSLK